MEARAAPSPDELAAAAALLLLLRTSPSTLSCSDELSSIHGGTAEDLSCISDSSSPSTGQIAGARLRIMHAADPLAALTRSIKSKMWKESSKLSSLRRRAAAIIAFLSSGTAAYEVRIREAVGDNPDTSKALRMLLRMEGVTRSGGGGQRDPFLYTVAVQSESTYF